jgi:hypothetical protein
MIDQMRRDLAHKFTKSFLGHAVVQGAVIHLDAGVSDKCPQHPGNLSGLADNETAGERPEQTEGFNLSPALDEPGVLRQLVKHLGRKFLLEFSFDFGYLLHKTVPLSLFSGCQTLLKAGYRLFLLKPELICLFIKKRAARIYNSAGLSDNL